MKFNELIGTALGALQTAAEVYQDTLRKEYERGLADGRREAEELRAKLALILNSERSDVERPAQSSLSGSLTISDSGEATIIRAPRGTVEPKILEALRGSTQGKKPSDIANATGIPENSVRGRLNILRKEHKATKRGEYWFSIPLAESTSGVRGETDHSVFS